MEEEKRFRRGLIGRAVWNLLQLAAAVFLTWIAFHWESQFYQMAESAGNGRLLSGAAGALIGSGVIGLWSAVHPLFSRRSFEADLEKQMESEKNGRSLQASRITLSVTWYALIAGMYLGMFFSRDIMFFCFWVLLGPLAAGVAASAWFRCRK